MDRRSLLIGGMLLGAGATAAAKLSSQNSLPARRFIMPRAAPRKEGIARSGSVDLWFWDTGGKGTPVILFHPYTGSAEVWGFQQPAFAAAGYRVIAYSRRGFYRSQAGSKEAPGTFADDLHAVLNHLRISEFHAVGSAQGSFVPLDYALSYRGRLRSMVLACSYLGMTDPEVKKGLERITPQGFHRVLTPEFRELSPTYRFANPEGTEAWRALEKISGASKILQPSRTPATLAALRTIKVPTLFIAGGADLYAPPPLLQLFSSHLPGSKLVTVPDAGHSVYWEQPGVFNSQVLNFLRLHR